MSISVSNITKLYGSQKALNNVSFSINKGEIVGFLGPNGAGKSTMMKILTGYIPQTTGTAQVADLDVQSEGLKIKKLTGYLPENNPMYTDMYVAEYLRFVAGSYGAKKSNVANVIEQTGLTPEKHKKIGQLSKGYRQRVGLAAALIHNPEVLILDEPTTGLDPNQLVEIRNLIKAIGKEKTVMLSTHIMQEVEQLCSRVIIINKGEIVADKPTEELRQSASAKVLVISLDKAVSVNELKRISGAKKVTKQTELKFEIETDQPAELRKAIFELTNQKAINIVELAEKTQDLESVFHALTQK